MCRAGVARAVAVADAAAFGPDAARLRAVAADEKPTKNARPEPQGRQRRKRAAARTPSALDRARSVFKRAGYTASGFDFSRLFPRGITLDADEFRSGVRRVLKVAPSTLSDADVRRVFRSVESEDAVALDALLAFVERAPPPADTLDT